MTSEMETQHLQQAEATCLRRGFGRQAKLDDAHPRNLPVRRSVNEGGKELGYVG